ncbi:hypothetical protein SEA_OCTOBIEN14_71 [Gordonia phage Octobien14]|uniref:Uncharacterized protein n=1 Tax=Gordonia phage Octobien14 TaxID=2483673 RepID=A0A3G3MAR3_9CAUD|nr:hypothetical protein L3Y22_gp071 [Gordonia phage Octobien14]AYR03217.1 hypothetical protein SEA_OCTOBIEN14_71 [Gordonia phage Octobien14]
MDQGTRHLVCSEVCDVCFNPIPSTDVDALSYRHSYCTPKTSKGRGAKPKQAEELEEGLI